MTERPLMFPTSNTLFGILSEPDDGYTKSTLPAVVILNAGLMHRIGPFRLHVGLARMLAKSGFTVVRVDCSGKGDSPARPDSESYRESLRDDLSEIFDHLKRKYGIEKIVLVGLCSGADDAFNVCGTDERVCGLVLLDGYAYRTPKFYLRRYGPKLVSPSVWINLLRRMVSRLLRGSSEPDAGDDDIFGMTFPPKKVFEEGLQQQIDRNNSILIVHSCGWAEYYNYEEQFQDAFPKLVAHDAIQVRYFPKADHTYSLSTDRSRLIACIADWMQKTFSSQPL